MPPSKLTDRGGDRDDALVSLLAAVTDGDARALCALYDLTSPKLYGIILRIVRNKSAAEDVLQDVYLRVWQSAGSFSPSAGRPFPWLISIARNRAIDTVRGKREVQAPLTEDGEDWMKRVVDPVDSEAALHDRAALRTCLDQLDPLHRDCVLLAYCEGASREELARRHDCSENTIKTWLRRSLANLKRCLEGTS